MFDIDWSVIWNHLITMMVAYLLAFPIAWNRESNARSAGIRTFPLVSIAACSFVLVGIDMFPDGASQARVIGGIITGIGFIGGGAILKNGDKVTGLATAASLWGTAAIGIAVGAHRLEIAVLLAIVTFVTLQLVTKVKDKVPEGEQKEHS
ncbi:MgtC/SapB family protein [Kangiella sediminilitoris]|uniref:Protein MgtC n=1 Tax=Kangiella sediminilitoris TaxID=1144748 RepID=A0A1B3B8Q7_9GAMM|nr:MgtC/SapB family protein [Kangiella sediminilitoris]AOE49194.1 MgtC/SapB transporter [Kangiella sediminilitoris]